MARTPQEGTPRESRSKVYVYPSRKRTVLWGSLIAGVALIVLLIGGYAAGMKRTFSPGDVASHHARIDLKCAQCHESGQQVEALRCERCHDPSGSERLSQAAHVLLGSGDARKADMAEMTECQTCHTEHRGLSYSIRQVDDRECARCHEFSTMATHPEFAIVRAKSTPGVGMKFNHDFHIAEVQKTRGATCQVCHVASNDRRDFTPMSFDQHCASCHAPEGTLSDTDPILGDLLVPPAQLPGEWRKGTGVEVTQRGRKQVGTKVRHRDSWVIFNALRIRQTIDRDGEAAERLTLRARIAYLQQLVEVRPVHEATPAELQNAVTALERELTDLDARLAPTEASDTDAIRETLNSAQVIAKLLAATDDSAKAGAQPILAETLSGPAKPLPADPEAQARFDRRKLELTRLLDTVIARTDRDDAKQRAAALKAEIEKLTAPATTNDADAAALLDRLSSLDEVFSAVRTIPDPGVSSQVAQIDLLRGYGQQAVSAGLSADDFESRRAELLELLDSIERRGGENVRIRIAPLRQRVLALRPGTAGDRELQRTRRAKQKQLDRVRLELELLASRDEYEAPRAQDDSVDPKTLTVLLDRLRQQLGELERSGRMSAAQSPEDRESRRNELDALMSRCLKCHEYDPSGVRMARVRATEPVMPRSIFNHAPHVTQTKCETCHDPQPATTPPTPPQCDPGKRSTDRPFGVSWSQCGIDVNVPGVANCQMCHKPSQARAECETCHVYHPSSPARLLTVSR